MDTIRTEFEADFVQDAESTGGDTPSFNKVEYLAQLRKSFAHESEQTRKLVSLLSTSCPDVSEDLVEETTIFKIKLLNLLRQSLHSGTHSGAPNSCGSLDA